MRAREPVPIGLQHTGCLTRHMSITLVVPWYKRFWITGERSDGKYIDVEGAGILFLAWRCLYAETVRARTNDEQLKLKHAYARVILMSISRLKAQGQKWYRWYSRTRGISEHKLKPFPRRYRKRRLMTTTATAEYEISDILLREYDSVKQDRL